MFVVWGLPPLQLLKNWVTPHLQLEACHGMPQHNKFFLGTISAWSSCFSGHPHNVACYCTFFFRPELSFSVRCT